MGIRIWIWIFLFLPGLFGFVPGLVDLWPRIWRDLLQGKRSRRRGRGRRKGRSLNKTKSFLRPQKRPRWWSKKLSQRITYKNGWFFNRFHPTQIFLWKPYSSKIVLYFKLCKIFSQNHFDVIETRPKHGLCSCNKSAAYSYQFNIICRTINSSQKNREITTGKTWQHPKITSNPALNKVKSDAKWKGLTS